MGAEWVMQKRVIIYMSANQDTARWVQSENDARFKPGLLLLLGPGCAQQRGCAQEQVGFWGHVGGRPTSQEHEAGGSSQPKPASVQFRSSHCVMRH